MRPPGERSRRGPNSAQSAKEHSMADVSLRVNGKDVTVTPTNTMLQFVLRDDLGLTGTKFGCGQAQCGCCTVLLDGQPVRSCVTPTTAAAGREVTTIEGIASGGTPHPLQ